MRGGLREERKTRVGHRSSVMSNYSRFASLVAAILNAIGSELSTLESTKSVFVQFYEIHGKKCYDLMDGRKNLRVLSDSKERVWAR